MASISQRDDDSAPDMAEKDRCGLRSGCAGNVPCAAELPVSGNQRRLAESLEQLAGLKRRYQKAGKMIEAKAVGRAMEILKG